MRVPPEDRPQEFAAGVRRMVVPAKDGGVAPAVKKFLFVTVIKRMTVSVQRVQDRALVLQRAYALLESGHIDCHMYSYSWGSADTCCIGAYLTAAKVVPSGRSCSAYSQSKYV